MTSLYVVSVLKHLPLIIPAYVTGKNSKFFRQTELQWSFPCLYDDARQTDFQWMDGVNPTSLHSDRNLESLVALHLDRFLKECVWL